MRKIQQNADNLKELWNYSHHTNSCLTLSASELHSHKHGGWVELPLTSSVKLKNEYIEWMDSTVNVHISHEDRASFSNAKISNKFRFKMFLLKIINIIYCLMY